MNQHYVPKVYLKNFAEPRGNEFYIDVFDKNTGKFIKPNIKGICAERHFYTLDDETKVATNKMAIEKIYSDFIEPMYQQAYDILTNDNIIYINEYQRAEILIGVMQLYTRNPVLLIQMQNNHRDEITRIIGENKMKGIKGVTYMDEDYSFSDFTDEMIFKDVENSVTKAFKELHLQGTQDILEYHAEAKFQVEKLNDNSSFISSDNPLVMTDSLSSERHPLLRSKTFTIALNRTYSLKILHDNSKELNRLYKCFAGGGNAWSANKDVIVNSSRFIITNEEGMKAYNKMETFMNNERPELKINIIRQVVEKFDGDVETEKSRAIMREFIKKYDAGETTPEDLQSIMIETMLLGKEITRQRIKG